MRVTTVVVVSLIAVASFPAAAAAQQPTLNGEQLHGPTGLTCPPDGVGNGSFRALAIGADGPYAGDAAETGTFTIANDDALTAFVADFTITSGATRISGRKSLSRTGRATCATLGPGVFLAAIEADTAYTARIDAPSGCYSDRGSSRVTIASSPSGAFTEHRMSESFTSAQPAATPCNEASINDAGPVAEGGVLRFSVSLVKPAEGLVSVRATTVPGSASAGSDYEHTSRVVTIPSGQRSATFEVRTLDDNANEPPETFGVTLSQPVGTVINDPNEPDGTGAILDTERNGDFMCRATGARIGTTELVVSNATLTPCRDGAASFLLPVRLGALSADALHTRVDVTPNNPLDAAPAPGDRADAHADAVDILIVSGVNVISARLLEANARARCVGTAPPTLESFGGVQTGTVNQQPMSGSDPTTLTLPGAKLHINQETINGARITRRALYLDNATLPDVVIGEAVAGYTGNPCSA